MQKTISDGMEQQLTSVFIALQFSLFVILNFECVCRKKKKKRKKKNIDVKFQCFGNFKNQSSHQIYVPNRSKNLNIHLIFIGLGVIQERLQLLFYYSYS